MPNLNKSNQQENMLLTIDEDIKSISEISVNEYNVLTINSIGERYKHYRQSSKAP